MDEYPITGAANSFSLVVVPTRTGEISEYVLQFGFLAPPTLVGPAEAQIAQAQTIDHVDVLPIVRLAFNRTRAEELRDLLVGVLQAAPK